MSFDVETIVSLISSVGFPIVVSAALFWKINRQDESHREEMDKMTEALNNNTKALEELIHQLGIGRDQDEDI